jgi:dephospho-CoA kinase
MLVIGLTGGIGTGKSEVARILGELGAEVIDADKVGHQVYAPHTEAWREIVRAFERQVLKPSGEVDREKLGAIVFGQPEKMARLNAITHPVITERIRHRIGELERRGVRVAVVEAALLTVTPLAGLADEVWVTDAPEEQVVERLARRSHLSREEVRRRISMQEPFSEMAKSAQVVVENRGSLDELREKVRALWERRVSERTG